MISSLFLFSGKLRRGEFFYCITFVIFVFYIFISIVRYFDFSPLFFWCVLPIFVWSLSVLQIKRFRDRSRSGWRYLVFLVLSVPYVTILAYSALFSVDLGLKGEGAVAAILASGSLIYFITPAIAQHLVEMFLLPGDGDKVDASTKPLPPTPEA
ncbi:DUF805 domain-containing protein [Roseibium algicola]|jgi:uncharacterized membrane protein YhaH (DUF805 family)|uniref:DUF805 domain-containing protein n=1 Tax=Roseibium algicola TaxID=2857014 RepID=UPI0034598C21